MHAVIRTRLGGTTDNCFSMKCRPKNDRDEINQQRGHGLTVLSERVCWVDHYVNQEKLLQLRW